MSRTETPYRSVLYMPGANARALEKARTLPADALILDLEDAVAPGEKARARDLVAAAVTGPGFGARQVVIRINGLATEWGASDLAMTCAAGPSAILLPKVGSARDVHEAARLIEELEAPAGTRLWAMMETPGAMLNAGAIAAAHPRLDGLVLGTNDLAADLGAQARFDRMPLVAGLSLCLLAARAEGLVCLDGVYNAFRDDAGFRAECEQGRAMGFDGKTLIHPAQIEIANAVFGPGEAEIARARAEVAAFEAAASRGEGIAVLDGQMVENLHVAAARALLKRAAAIKAHALETLIPAEGGTA